jgi:hypothetical protein
MFVNQPTAASIKSIQQVSCALTVGATTGDVTISAVTTAKCVIIDRGRTVNSSNTLAVAQWGSWNYRAELTTATNLRITYGAAQGSGTTVTHYLTVIEYN